MHACSHAAFLIPPLASLPMPLSIPVASPCAAEPPTGYRKLAGK